LKRATGSPAWIGRRGAGVLLAAAVLGVVVARPGVAQTTTGISDLGLQPVDVTRPAEQAHLMADRNAALLGTGPVDPDTYVLGPGDLMGLEILGAVTISAEDVIGADGSITFPQIGTLSLGGLTLTAAREELGIRARGLVRGKEAPRLLLKTMRTFKVSVVGLVAGPGAQPASPVTRVSECLQAAGGFTRGADSRNVRVRHADGTEGKADLLPFLIDGSLGTNPTLRDGDVVVVDPRTHDLTFSGALLHAGRFDFVDGDELGAMLRLLQLDPSADRTRAMIQRYRDGVTWDTLSVELGPVLDGTMQVPLKAEDRVLVRAIGEWHTGAVAEVRGAVRFPGPIPIRRGEVTVKGAIEMAGGALDDATLSRIVLSKPFLPDSTVRPDANPWRNYVQGLDAQTLHERTVDLSGGGAGPIVEPSDVIYVPRREPWVEVLGQVRNPGFYLHYADWSFKDYVQAAGGFAKHADKDKTQLSRGRFGTIGYAKDADDPAPGDVIWVPERSPHNFWPFLRDAVAITSQAVTLVLVVQQALK
jgi:protein involved in polysaccharide export with SLBB domain